MGGRNAPKYALGTKFQHSPEKEIGYFPIELTADGKNDPLLKHFDNTELVGHWHNDMPGLQPSFKVLAESQGCPRQIVKFMNLVYGFQCHLEFTKQSVVELVESAFEPQHVGIKQWVQDKDAILNRDTKRMNELLFVFLDNLVEHMNEKAANPRLAF
jgi:GMP synthase (glutamine-hydrolysing)